MSHPRWHCHCALSYNNHCVFWLACRDEYVLDFMACKNAPGSVMNFDAGPCWLHQAAECSKPLRDPTGVECLLHKRYVTQNRQKTVVN